MTGDGTDLYEVLGVSPQASQADIRRAFKRLALKHHPDKAKGEDAMFKKVNDAYQILSDPEKRDMYDGLRHATQSATGGADYSEIFKMFITVMMGIVAKKTGLTSNLDVRLSITVTMEELYRGDIKKMCISTRRATDQTVQKNLYIPLSAGLKRRYVFEGQGDEGPNGEKGDIIIKTTLKEHPLVKRDHIVDDNDLYIEDTMTLYEYYRGVHKEYAYLNNETLRVDFVPNRTENHTAIYIAKNKGLPYKDDDGDQCRGNLYIHYRLVLPDNVDNEVIGTFR